MDWKQRRTLPSAAVKRVAIVGGTHGNETNGVQLAKHFMRNLEMVQRPSFETEVMLANLGAIESNTRYVDEDLNRCYLLEDLKDDTKANSNKERKRARELDQVLGPKSSAEPRCDLVIDLHNTTSATDIALLMAPDDEFSHQIAYHLRSLDSGVRVINWNNVADCASVRLMGVLLWTHNDIAWDMDLAGVFVNVQQLGLPNWTSTLADEDLASLQETSQYFPTSPSESVLDEDPTPTYPIRRLLSMAWFGVRSAEINGDPVASNATHADETSHVPQEASPGPLPSVQPGLLRGSAEGDNAVMPRVDPAGLWTFLESIPTASEESQSTAASAVYSSGSQSMMAQVPS